MSLIIEALKKARDDAVRRQAAARGLPLAPVPKLESRSRWLSVALIPLAAALVICVMLLIDVYSRFPESTSPQKRSRQSAATDNSTGDSLALQASPPPDDATTDNGAVPARSTPPAVRSERPPVQSPPLTTPENAVIETAPDAGSAPLSEQPSRTDSTTSSPTPNDTRDSRVSTGQAQLQGGQVIDLGGIAWSESEPYALINGQVVGVGELVRSYRVTSITPNEVVLEKDEDRVIVRLE